MNRFEPGEIVTFEKWVKGEFGSDEPSKTTIRLIDAPSLTIFLNIPTLSFLNSIKFAKSSRTVTSTMATSSTLSITCSPTFTGQISPS